MNRRSFLTGLAAALAAPAIVNAASLMPLRGIVMHAGGPVTWFVGPMFGEIEDGTAAHPFSTFQRAIDRFLSLNDGRDLTLDVLPGHIEQARPDHPIISWRGRTLGLRGADWEIAHPSLPAGATIMMFSDDPPRGFEKLVA